MDTKDGQNLGWGRVRCVAFFVWAAILPLLFGIAFTVVTLFTIGLWLADQNPDTNPVVDLGFFALGTVITTGFVVQLRAPKRKISGLQQAVVDLLTLGAAGMIGGRIEPLTGSLLFIFATAILVALHPTRRELFRVGARLSPHLAALSILSTVPAAAYATTMLAQAQQAGPSCLFGRCTHGDRFAQVVDMDKMSYSREDGEL